jgi:hypothetical protein
MQIVIVLSSTIAAIFFWAATMTHFELIENNQYTMQLFLAKRGIVMSTNSLKARKVYPFVLITDRPAEGSDQDARWVLSDSSGQQMFYYFSDKRKACP